MLGLNGGLSLKIGKMASMDLERLFIGRLLRVCGRRRRKIGGMTGRVFLFVAIRYRRHSGYLVSLRWALDSHCQCPKWMTTPTNSCKAVDSRWSTKRARVPLVYKAKDADYLPPSAANILCLPLWNMFELHASLKCSHEKQCRPKLRASCGVTP